MKRLTIKRLTTAISLASLASLFALATGCARTLPPPRVAPTVIRVAAESDNVSNDGVGSAADRLVRDCLSRSWAQDFKTRHGRLPVIKVRALRNVAVPVSAAETLREQLEQAFVRSGQVQLASHPAYASGDVAAELADQRAHASDETMKQARPQPAAGTGIGTDFVLGGTLTIRGGSAVVAYLHLMAIESNEKVWIAIRPV